MVKLYRTHVPDYMAQLMDAYHQGDKSTMQDFAHKLSSAMGIIDDFKSLEIFRRLEKEQLSDEEIANLIDEASIRVTRTIAEL